MSVWSGADRTVSVCQYGVVSTVCQYVSMEWCRQAGVSMSVWSDADCVSVCQYGVVSTVCQYSSMEWYRQCVSMSVWSGIDSVSVCQYGVVSTVCQYVSMEWYRQCVSMSVWSGIDSVSVCQYGVVPTADSEARRPCRLESIQMRVVYGRGRRSLGDAVRLPAGRTLAKLFDLLTQPVVLWSRNNAALHPSFTFSNPYSYSLLLGRLFLAEIYACAKTLSLDLG